MPEMATRDRQGTEREWQRDFTFRALGFGRGQEYYAICIDLDIIVRGETWPEAQQKLVDAVEGYLESVFAHGLQETHLRRLSPARYRLLWHFGRTLHLVGQFKDGLRSRLMAFVLAGPPNRLRVA